MNLDAKVYVAGHRGLVGSAIVRRLQQAGYTNIVVRTHAELDLTRHAAVDAFFETERPAWVFLAAARVGGILANSTYGGDFLRENLLIATFVIDAAYRFGATRLCFLGSSCIYPKFAPQPIHEDSLLTGALEPTNQPYAIAKIAGLEMVHTYRKQFGFDAYSLMPTNLYGPNDNFDLASSHVLPALIRKFHEAKAANQKTVTVWGTGKPMREFLHCDDLAEACLFTMANYKGDQVLNVGTGQDVTIAELAALVGRTVGYQGEIVYDASKPDGTPRKVLDVSRIHALGWQAKTSLERGVAETYAWFCAHQAGAGSAG